MLRFSPAAWAKLLYLRDRGETEVGGFGISSADDLFYLEDVSLVRQACTCVSVKFDDLAVADHFDRQVDEGLQPEQFARIWVHTHPGDCPLPSGIDEATFARVFSASDWAVMFILAEGGQTYARLRFNVGPGGSVLVPVEVDYGRPFAGSNESDWEQEYLACVEAEAPALVAERGLLLEPTRLDPFDSPRDDGFFDPWGRDHLADTDFFAEEAWYDLG